MTRLVPEWIGKTDDTTIPLRVQLRIVLKYKGRCAICTRKFRPGVKAFFDHILALVNGGENREKNLQPLCDWCHPDKTKVDVAIKSKTAKVRAKNLGIKKTRSPIQSRGFQKSTHKYSRAQNRMVKR